MSGTITVRRPRVRGLDERFESRLLPLFKRRTEEVGRLLPELYLHGLAHGDFDLALRGLLGAAAPLSAASIARLKASWQAEYETLEAPAAGRPRARVRLGGRHLRQGGAGEGQGGDAGADRGAARRAEGRPRGGEWVSGVDGELGRAAAGPQGAAGCGPPRLVIADGHLGIWGAVATVFPEVDEQRCWNHRIVNVLDTLPQKLQGEGRALLTKIPYAETREEAERQKGRVPGVGHDEGGARRGPAPRGGLGAAGDLLRVPEGALEAPADDERGRVAVRGGAVADGGGEAVQEGGERDGGDLEDAAGRRAELPAPRRAGAPAGGGRGRRVRQRRASEAGQREGGRLIFFTHLLTRPRHPAAPVVRRSAQAVQ